MGEYGQYRPLVRLALVLCVWAAKAQACGLALVLAIDVSLSVDEHEFALQTGGIAAALRDPSVASAIGSVEGGVAISLMQWSGRGDQAVSLPWRLVSGRDEINALAQDISGISRAFGSKTAPGSALLRSVQLHESSPYHCDRQVTDMSGDGIENSGVSTRSGRDTALGHGHTVNGLVILGDDDRLEAFYRHNVIGGPGHFLEIAHGFDDYGRAMRDKLLKELPRLLAMGAIQ